MGTLIHGQAGQQVSPTRRHRTGSAGTSPMYLHVGRAPMRPIPHVAPELRFTSRLRSRLFKSVLRDMIEQLASRRAYAHVYPPPITKPLLIPTRAHPPPIVLGYITLCCHRFCDTIALCRGNPKRNDTGACTANTASCAQSIKTPPRH